MQKRYAVLWLPYLLTDWFLRKNQHLHQHPVVFASPMQGRMVITAVNPTAQQMGIARHMVLADAKAAVPQLHVEHDKAQRRDKLLTALALWCIKFTPAVARDGHECILLDITGCTHLWGTEQAYLSAIVRQLDAKGYQLCCAAADTIGAAWAAARHGAQALVIAPGEQLQVLAQLPVSALRLDPQSADRLCKLGFRTLGSFVHIPDAALKRRFGDELVDRLHAFLGKKEEYMQLLRPVSPYTERLPCLEPIRTKKGIEMGIDKLLVLLCQRLAGEGKGLRKARLSCYRVDGRVVTAEIGTNRASAHVPHLASLFAQKIPQIEPALGIELFVMEALSVDVAPSSQELLWRDDLGLEDHAVAELLDRMKGRDRSCQINRYLPSQQHWPERSIRAAASLSEKNTVNWPTDKPRPTRLLHPPQHIEVTAPIPDYPPMLFRYQGQVHHIKRADGPERIECEWWIEPGEHRDYYYVEDADGRRYWLFRLGHYASDGSARWYLHGFFA